MAPRRKCPICGSKQWHKDRSSGLVACREGHVLQNYRTEADEAEDLGNHTMKKRTLKSGRKKKEKESKADPKLYHGERARFHYYQCLQLLLRKQIATLTTLWNLPPEFETICRDTWALHLNLLPNPPPPEPYHHLQDQEGPKTKPIKPSQVERTANSNQDQESGDSGSESSSPSEDDADDAELEELLRENSEISSSSDDDRAGKHRSNTTARGKQGLVGNYDGPANNIALLVVACWIMRIPVMYMDFIRAIESYKLPYLEPVPLLPPSLARHLTKHAVQALSPHHAPTTLLLHRLASRVAKHMYAKFGVFTPELNASPVLWRVVRQCFGGAPTLYALTKRLGHILSLPLTLHHSLAPTLRRIKRDDPESHKFDNVPPELALAATTIIVLKCVYGLDGKARLPTHPDDPACALPKLDNYLALLRELNEADSKNDDTQFSSITPMAVGDLDEDTIDRYLDFCGRVLVGQGRDSSEHRILDNYFPLSNEIEGPKAPAITPLLAAVTLPSTRMSDDEKGVLRPGESYTIYNSRDILGNLPVEYELVIGRAGRWVGVSSDYLCGVVERYEQRLVRWWKGVRRREREEGRDQEETSGSKGQK
ncbi:hypothetical protein BJ138DRAFT_1144338 [Hygrophoropsis aurantiaca]|uniref:Uncharacterized protein n=1 Tax=Hygrophoropsis aurantiaca TaxID=72124 RepID=A0ACB8ALF4_9AGAM|nr:hypothetical protein BJ138DRAFT_1144338 [Hygrophoropsis aurantiaca]